MTGDTVGKAVVYEPQRQRQHAHPTDMDATDLPRNATEPPSRGILVKEAVATNLQDPAGNWKLGPTQPPNRNTGHRGRAAERGAPLTQVIEGISQKLGPFGSKFK